LEIFQIILEIEMKEGSPYEDTKVKYESALPNISDLVPLVPDEVPPIVFSN